MSADSISTQQINNFLTFKNPNNFDDYFATVLPSQSNYIKYNIYIIIDGLNLIYVTNEPHKKSNHKPRAMPISTNVIEKNKNSEFLAHKTIDNGGKKINGFIGRKRECKKNKTDNSSVNSTNYNENNNNNNDSEFSEKFVMNSNKIEICFNCKWKFPDRMSIARRNIHINNCFEGKGKLDEMKYFEEQKIKNYRNLSYKKLHNLATCPICGKHIQTSNCKTKYNHLSYCIKHL